MLDVLVVGAGPAGAVAATVLARNGARVRLVDRARFPRDKLCGDTVNPGALALLRRLGMAGPLEVGGLAIDGMLVTGRGGVMVEGRYPEGLQGRALVRREMDHALVDQAVVAGAEFEPSTTVRGALVDGGSAAVRGVIVNGRSAERMIRARAVIAADGRHSALAFGLGLACHPERPRRWAVGAYFENVRRTTTVGEMHIRPTGYIGVAPLPGGLTNVCLVRAWNGSADSFGNPAALLWRELAADEGLRARFDGAQMVAKPVILGPLAVDVRSHAIEGLLLAGDAAGFIDPMTGDGLRFAVRGGELAAAATLRALEHGWHGVHASFDRARCREFSSKWRFNRALRALVSSPAAIRFGQTVAAAAPSVLGAIIRRAGDCGLDA